MWSSKERKSNQMPNKSKIQQNSQTKLNRISNQIKSNRIDSMNRNVMNILFIDFNDFMLFDFED
jgi:hypothetical protein